MAAAIFLGGAIGYERELGEHPAGLRTHLLVALGSATFMLISSQFTFFQHYPSEVLVRVDGSRIASNVVVGIGFLGGGAILHSGPRIKGLTTAASLWLVASVGLASGAGMYLVAVTTTVLTMFALVFLRYAVEEPRKHQIDLSVRIDMQGEFISRVALVEFLAPLGAKVSRADYSRNITTNRSELNLAIRLKSESLEEPLMKRLETLPGVIRVEVERPDV